jgi:Mn-dependent DtxR family transcriptional regulator
VVLAMPVTQRASFLIAWSQAKTGKTLGKENQMNAILKAEKLTSANEDYLEAIYELGGASGPVRSVDLASKLGVSKASVNNAVNNLKQAGLVEQPYYGDISLTEQGTKYAASVLERHHVLYHFLLDVLGVEPLIAAEEACLMEHAISDDTLERLTKHLKSQVLPQ